MLLRCREHLLVIDSGEQPLALEPGVKAASRAETEAAHGKFSIHHSDKIWGKRAAQTGCSFPKPKICNANIINFFFNCEERAKINKTERYVGCLY
jgi:hypothetical protein